jgi:integrase
MATLKQRTSGWWQAVIRRKGQPLQSKTFAKKIDAEAWARDVENKMDRSVFVDRSLAESTTFTDAASRYVKEVLPSKRSGDRDKYRLKSLTEEFGAYSLATITPSMISTFRDKRLALGLSAQSVVHDINMMSRIFKTAVLDWGIPLASVPTSLVRKPAVSNARTRRLVADEEIRLLAAIDQGENPWVKPIVILAIETAARQSELLSMTWKDVDLKKRIARLRGADGRELKNKDTFRDVPLSSRAVKVLDALPKTLRGPVFPVTAEAFKQSWQRAVRRARLTYEQETLLSRLVARGLLEKEAKTETRKVLVLGGRKPAKPTPPRTETLKITAALADDPLLVDLHFHDLRHEATTRLAEKLQIHELMKVLGHKSTKMVARYYHPRAEDLAKKLG